MCASTRPGGQSGYLPKRSAAAHRSLRDAETASLQGLGFCGWRVIRLAVHGCWVDEPEGVLLCEHDLVLALGLRAVFFQVVQALLVGVAGFGSFRVGPLVEGFVEMAVAGGDHEAVVEEVPTFLVGEDIRAGGGCRRS